MEQSETDINVILQRQMRLPGQQPATGESVPPAKPDLAVALPLPTDLPPLYLPIPPLAGPVILLTAPALSPAGELLSRTGAKPAASAVQARIDEAFVEGRLAKSRPGRADDFAWIQR